MIGGCESEPVQDCLGEEIKRPGYSGPGELKGQARLQRIAPGETCSLMTSEK